MREWQGDATLTDAVIAHVNQWSTSLGTEALTPAELVGFLYARLFDPGTANPVVKYLLSLPVTPEIPETDSLSIVTETMDLDPFPPLVLAELRRVVTNLTAAVH